MPNQFCLNLNHCAVHNSWNNGDLIKQTHRTQVKGITNLQWAASDLSNPQSLTHTAVARWPIWLGSAARLHTPELRHHYTLSWIFSRLLVWPSSLHLYKALLLLHFSKQQKEKHALLYYGSKFLLLKWMDDKYDFTLPGFFFFLKSSMISSMYLHILTRDADVASLRDLWARILSNAWTVAGFHC